MHYRHGYHAGNFADVFKHVLLCGLLTALNRKDKPWCYVDTHAGAGFYDLGGEGAARTGEWREGVARLLALNDAPEPMRTYLDAVRAANPDGKLLPSPPAAQALDALASSARQAARLTYPGSPAFALHAARGDDRLILCEKTPAVAAELKSVFAREPRVAVHVRDGYEAQALLPPAQKRGLVLVDPPFERGDELEAMSQLAQKSLARFAGGIYALWYPVKNRRAVDSFRRRMARELAQPMLDFEFDNGAPKRTELSASGIEKLPLRACGLLVVNPPFRFEEETAPALALLARTLAQGPDAACTSTWLRRE